MSFTWNKQTCVVTLKARFSLLNASWTRVDLGASSTAWKTRSASKELGMHSGLDSVTSKRMHGIYAALAMCKCAEGDQLKQGHLPGRWASADQEGAQPGTAGTDRSSERFYYGNLASHVSYGRWRGGTLNEFHCKQVSKGQFFNALHSQTYRCRSSPGHVRAFVAVGLSKSQGQQSLP